MSDKQLTIPGLEPPVKTPKKPANQLEKRVANLEARVLALEVENTLLNIDLEYRGG